MTFLMTFSNNETVTLPETARFHAWKNDTSYLSVDEDQAFYLEVIFSGSYQEALQSAKANQQTDSQPVNVLAGLLASADWLTLDDHPDKYYRTSTIVSLEVQSN
ncbi:hypothetical protein [Latilactobacillus sakei]|uniref:hypothetical protein n=1 Tax=Latilactobacillus sakei TaxID=1599 RepID=UPI000DC64528|nr:hypothetical protein [Latilactobacillus sakei]SPS03528.1 hypothetical protein LAS9624_00344 [Latilactobacillus sakei]